MMSGGAGVSFSKKQDLIPKECCKVNTMYKQLETKNAVAYLKMREDGCPRNPALVFCQRTTCKFDSTITQAGPSMFRKLKLRTEKNPVTENGWLNAMPMYDLGEGYTTGIKEIIKEPDNELIKRNNDIDKNNVEFKERVHFLYKYYTELVEKSSLFNLRKQFQLVDQRRITFNDKNILHNKHKKEDKEKFIQKLNEGNFLANKIQTKIKSWEMKRII